MGTPGIGFDAVVGANLQAAEGHTGVAGVEAALLVGAVTYNADAVKQGTWNWSPDHYDAAVTGGAAV